MGTAALFACFSAAAMFAEKRLYVYLIGVMGTMAVCRVDHFEALSYDSL